MTDDEHEYRRKNDVTVTKIQDTLDSFIERYKRDLNGQNVQLTEISVTIKSHDEFIKIIQPIYAKGMIILGAGIIGSVGIGVTWFWKHFTWHG